MTVPHRSNRNPATRIPGLLLVAFWASVALPAADRPVHLADAIAAQRQLVAESPSSARALNDLANLLVLDERFEEAAETYRAALAVDGGDASVRYNYALLLLEMGARKPAQKELEQVLSIDPDHAWAHYQLGTVLHEQRRRRAAIDHYSRAFYANPDLLLPRVNPHIVENDLATDALLKANLDHPGAALAPRLYDEPGRIADILVPEAKLPEKAAPDTEEVTESPAATWRVHSDESATAPVNTDPAPAERIEAGPGQLDVDPLPDTDRAVAPAPPVSTTNPTGATTGGSENSPRDVGGLVGNPSAVPGTVSGTPPTQPVFTPGTSSTGRLEFELIPNPEPGQLAARR